MTEITSMKAKCLESFATVDQGIQQIQELFRSTRSETGQLKQEIHRLHDQIHILKSELRGREATIARLEKDLQWRDNQLAEVSRAALEAGGENLTESQKKKVQRAQETIARLQADLKRAAETIKQNEDVIRFKDRHIEQLQSAAAGGSAGAAGPAPASVSEEELLAAIRTRDLDLQRMQRALEVKQEHLQRLAQEREEIRARVVKILGTL